MIYVETNKQDDITWYFNYTQISEIIGNHTNVYVQINGVKRDLETD